MKNNYKISELYYVDYSTCYDPASPECNFLYIVTAVKCSESEISILILSPTHKAGKRCVFFVGSSTDMFSRKIG